MSNAAKFEVPDSGDNGKTYVYSSGSDSHVLTSLAALYQPLDSDLTAIAALTTTSTGRSLLAAADAAAIRTIAGAEASGAAASAVSAHDADTSVHGIADTSALVTTTSAPELIRDTVGSALVAGSNVTITVDDGADTITIASSVTSAVYDPLDTIAASGSATSADISTYGVVDITLTGNCTISITGPTAGQGWSATFILRQDGTGSRTVSWPAGTVWPGGSEPTLSTAAGAIDIVVLMTVDGGTEWFGSLAGKGFS